MSVHWHNADCTVVNILPVQCFSQDLLLLQGSEMQHKFLFILGVVVNIHSEMC